VFDDFGQLHALRERVLVIELPPSLAPLAGNHRELFAALDLLDVSVEPVVRADLASELVGIARGMMT
jgi:hypothetical protein